MTRRIISCLLIFLTVSTFLNCNADRSKLSAENVIIGHWKGVDADAHIYISNTEITEVINGEVSYTASYIYDQGVTDGEYSIILISFPYLTELGKGGIKTKNLKFLISEKNSHMIIAIHMGMMGYDSYIKSTPEYDFLDNKTEY